MEVVDCRVVLRVEAAVHLEKEVEPAVLDQQCERAEGEEPIMGVVVGVVVMMACHDMVMNVVPFPVQQDVVMDVVPFPIHQDAVIGGILLVFHNERRLVSVLLAADQRYWRKAAQLRYVVLHHQLIDLKTRSVRSQYWLKSQSEHCFADVEEHPYKIPSFEGGALVEILPSRGVLLGKVSVQTSQKANEQEFPRNSPASIPTLVPEGPASRVLSQCLLWGNKLQNTRNVLV